MYVTNDIDVEHPFMWLFDIWISSVKCCFMCFSHFLIEFVFCLYCYGLCVCACGVWSKNSGSIALCLMENIPFHWIFWCSCNSLICHTNVCNNISMYFSLGCYNWIFSQLARDLLGKPRSNFDLKVWCHFYLRVCFQ